MILIEFVEVLMPFAYIFVVLGGYYGPNAGIIGNIGNSCWSYNEIEDMSKLLIALFRMFCIDIMAGIIGLFLL